VAEEGQWLPSTPVLSVVPAGPRRWHVAAALLSPPATAWVLERCAGAALAPSALKPNADLLRALPLPAPGRAWDEAAAAVAEASRAPGAEGRRAALLRAADATCRAYGVDAPGLVAWWAERLPAP
jgi:hypothetical protein